jgi:hypothetical protein
MRIHLLSFLLASWLVGCAHVQSGPPPRYEHVYLLELEQALGEARALMEERGFTFEPPEGDGTQLLTTWVAPPPDNGGTGLFHRYMVVGLRVAPQQSVVRIFRMTRPVTSADVEVKSESQKILMELAVEEDRPNVADNPMKAWSPTDARPNIAEHYAKGIRGVSYGTRDLDLEKVLTLRLESRPSVETLSGNIAMERQKTPTRAEDFYLARWKHELAGGVPEQELCGNGVEGLHALLQPGLTLLVGEQLGSREAPATVGDMVCQAALGGARVVLGLSVPSEDQERIDRYLSSAGTPADQDQLLGGRFWLRTYQDGRSSRAMLDLIDRVRALRGAGLRIDVVAYDTELASGNERDMFMARSLLLRRADLPKELFIVLSGNAHVAVKQGASWDAGFVPLGSHLAKTGGPVKALDLSYAQGTRWTCDMQREKLDCRIYGATPSPKVAAAPGRSPFIRLFPDISEEGYHGLLYVGALSASPPATMPPSQTPALPPGSSIRAPKSSTRSAKDQDLTTF